MTSSGMLAPSYSRQSGLLDKWSNGTVLVRFRRFAGRYLVLLSWLRVIYLGNKKWLDETDELFRTLQGTVPSSRHCSVRFPSLRPNFHDYR
jgi:hypothetical protein